MITIHNFAYPTSLFCKSESICTTTAKSKQSAECKQIADLLKIISSISDLNNPWSSGTLASILLYLTNIARRRSRRSQISSIGSLRAMALCRKNMGTAWGRETISNPDRDHQEITSTQDRGLTVWFVFDWEDMLCPPEQGTEEAHDSSCGMSTTKYQDRDHEQLPTQNWLQANREKNQPATIHNNRRALPGP